MSHSQMQRYIISPYSPHISQKICFENNKNTQSLVNSAYCYSVVNPILHLIYYSPSISSAVRPVASAICAVVIPSSFISQSRPKSCNA